MSFTNEKTKKVSSSWLLWDLKQEGKKLTETARQQIQSAVLSLNTRGPEARDITGLRNQAEVDRALRRMLSRRLRDVLPSKSRGGYLTKFNTYR